MEQRVIYKFEDMLAQQSENYMTAESVSMTEYFGKTKFSNQIDKIFAKTEVLDELEDICGLTESTEFGHVTYRLGVLNECFKYLDRYDLTLPEMMNAVFFLSNNYENIAKKLAIHFMEKRDPSLKKKREAAQKLSELLDKLKEEAKDILKNAENDNDEDSPE